MQFHETGYGRRFYEQQLPDLIKAINSLNETLKKQEKEQPFPVPEPYDIHIELKDSRIINGLMVGTSSVSVFIKTELGITEIKNEDISFMKAIELDETGKMHHIELKNGKVINGLIVKTNPHHIELKNHKTKPTSFFVKTDLGITEIQSKDIVSMKPID